MTAGNNDDPFAYLYRPEGGEADADGDAAQGRTAAQPGVPRTSYNQVQRVGERRQAVPPQQPTGYGHPPPQPYGRRPGPQPQPQPIQPMPQAGRGHAGHGGHGGGPQGRSPNSKGLLIGAVAVVAAVAIGIGVAIANGDSGDQTAGGGASPAATVTGGGSGSTSPSTPASGSALPGVRDAATLTLSGGASVATDVSGAQAAGGRYVAGMNAVGASASWTFEVPSGGRYTLFVTYGVPGSDSDSTLTVNGENQSRPLSMKNYAGAPSGNWKKGWTRTYGYISLKQGRNTVAISCESGNTCDFYLDQVWLKRGQVTG